MKRFIFIISFVALSLSVLAHSSVLWLETKHNFGAFSEDDGPATTTFRFVNTGSDPVSILAANASCGCTSPKYTREPISPGDTAAIIVTYDPAGRPGRFTKYVGVELSGGIPKVKLYISGSVVGNLRSIRGRFPVEADSTLSLAGDVVLFGPMTKKSMRTYNLQAYNHSADTIRPALVDLPRYVKADIVPPCVPPGEQMTFIVYFNGASCPLYGLVTDTIALVSAPTADPYPILVSALLEEDFASLTPKQLADSPVASLDKDRLDFPDIKSRGPVDATVRLTNTGRSELIVRRVYSSDPGIAASADKLKIKPGKSADIAIHIAPEAFASGILNARVAIITNDPNNPTQTIRLTGL